MFERFTNQARRVVVLAQEESRELNHNYIGTEHLVLGLLREGEGTGARALEAVGITLEAARREVETRIGRGHQEQSGHIPFTPRAKKSLEMALRESLTQGDEYIGTGHILLGLIRKGDGVGVEVLVSLGADLDAVRGRVIELLQDDTEQGTVRSQPERSAPPRAERHPGTIQALLDAIDTRLTVIERHLGIIRPVPAELRAFDKQIAKVVGAKEEAIERQDFEEAARLREEEKRLRSDRARMQLELEKASRGEGSEAAPGSQTEPEFGESPVTGDDLGAVTGDDLGAVTGDDLGAVTRDDLGAVTGDDLGAVTGDDLGAGPAAGEGARSDEVARLSAEVARLTALLREHGIDLEKPQDPPAAAG